MKDFISILVGILVTMIMYCGLPFILRAFCKERFDETTASHIALANSITIGLINFLYFIILNSTLNISGTWTIGPALVYYPISKWLLYDKPKEIKKHDESNISFF